MKIQSEKTTAIVFDKNDAAHLWPVLENLLADPNYRGMASATRNRFETLGEAMKELST